MRNKFEIKRELSIEQIQDAALILFAEKGFEKTTVRMIAEQAKIALGLLYNYFPSKEELLKSLFLKYFADMRATLKPDGDQVKSNDIEHHIRQTVKLLKQNRSSWKLVHGLRLQSSVFASLEKDFLKENEFIQKRMEENLINAGIPFPGLEAKLLFATLDGIINHYLLQDNYPVDDVANLLIMRYQSLMKPASS